MAAAHRLLGSPQVQRQPSIRNLAIRLDLAPPFVDSPAPGHGSRERGSRLLLLRVAAALAEKTTAEGAGSMRSSASATARPASSSGRRRLISRSRGRRPGLRSEGPLVLVRELLRQKARAPPPLLHLQIEFRRRRIELLRFEIELCPRRIERARDLVWTTAGAPVAARGGRRRPKLRRRREVDDGGRSSGGGCCSCSAAACGISGRAGGLPHLSLRPSIAFSCSHARGTSVLSSLHWAPFFSSDK
ncbi:unnamed protein product [Urochloa humidicola]